ncbi:hypothetical protein ACEXQD_17380 [Herbiconiux sp. P15]|uniref:hypothetical protein n=1 Tax=Herbiconiux liukaitaii TaxID=3342799 RepID=UPI0035BA880A
MSLRHKGWRTDLNECSPLVNLPNERTYGLILQTSEGHRICDSGDQTGQGCPDRNDQEVRTE